MAHPQQRPRAKHDLFLGSDKLLEPSIRQLSHSTNTWPEKAEPHRVAIYTYQQPCPLRRSMIIGGRLRLSVPCLQKQLQSSKSQSCVVGVKRTKDCLSEQDRTNSKLFANLAQPLRGDGAVALFCQDKHGRLGFLMPFDEENHAATCVIGNANAIIALLLAATKKVLMPGGESFHKNAHAAAADKKYSGLVRDLKTRGESKLISMRCLHGWIKACHIQEVNPQVTQSRGRRLRVLDLACGKGGDLKKWVYHAHGLERYVGIDVARGSLKDAAKRVQEMTRKPPQCAFVCADLGSDVPGRHQPLLSWSLGGDSNDFKYVPGGGILPSEKFDVVSIQFAIHYMMSSPDRAKRFFRTVSDLLEVGGELIATTIDARVVVDHLMNLGRDLHLDNEDQEDREDVVITLGGGACRLAFKRDVVKHIFKRPRSSSRLDSQFGLEYTFTLTEGSDHAAGVGTAVDLPEWLTPLPLLVSLAREVGLELESAQNFHEFYSSRSDSRINRKAHQSFLNMVLNRNGSISKEEWEISRLYCALKFRKVRSV